MRLINDLFLLKLFFKYIKFNYIFFIKNNSSINSINSINHSLNCNEFFKDFIPEFKFKGYLFVIRLWKKLKF